MSDDAARWRERFAAAPVARMATITPAGRPHVVPVTCAVSGDTIYWAVDHKPKRSRRLARLANLAANPAVAMVADHYEEDWSLLWWVRADGTGREVTDPAERARALAALTAAHPQYADRPPEGPVVAVDVERWSGWEAAR